ncbi:MAG: acyltransferase family protein [Chitinophagaceae bacterium]
MKDNKIFFPNLDGLRFFCFLAVFLYHSFATSLQEIKNDSLYSFIKYFLFANGNLGVNFFFVLSGFLITYLLIIERTKEGTVSIRNFYARRILRIWPLFYLCVFIGFFLFPLMKIAIGENSIETVDLSYYLFFLNNFDLIKNGFPDASILSVLWSVAIEEQFYLVWPVLMTYVPMRFIKWVFLIIIGSTFIFRLYHAQDFAMVEYHTFSCISDMAVGGFFAYLCYYNRRFLDTINRLPKIYWLLLYLAVAILFLFRKNIFGHSDVLIATDRLVCSLIFVLVIIEQCYATNSLFKMSKFKKISIWGTYTYGLYCLHMLGILMAAKLLSFAGLNKNVFQVILMEGILSFVLTLGLAYSSYHIFEKRFLRLKKKFAVVQTGDSQDSSNVN